MTAHQSDLPAPAGFDVRTSDGAVLSAFVEGRGQPLLLVTGLGGGAAFWASIAETLARSFRVIRFDQRGIGASTRGSDACSIETLARDCLAVLDEAGIDRAVVLGHSTGGCIAQTLAHLAPERVGGLILSGSWLRPNHYMAGYFGARREIIGTNPEAYAATSVLCAYPPAWIEANWHVYEAALAAAPLTAVQQEVMRERIDALLAFDGRDQMSALTVPVLVLGARDDMIVPAFLQEEIVAALPGCAKTMLDTGGHLFPVSRPDAFTATVADWIGRLA